MRRLYGARYVDDANARLAVFCRTKLHTLDFDDCRIAYKRLIASKLRPKDIALLGCNDRFFLLSAILGRKDAFDPWLYDRCREVEDKTDGYLDLWAREHYKSTIITFAGTIQEIMRDPEITIGLFSFSKDTATKFLKQIKYEFEKNQDLRTAYPDVIWDKPKVQAPSWTDEGLTVRRRTNPKERTIEASGLIDSMPIGSHYRLMIYDDIVTEHTAQNPDMVQKAILAWENSDNLGAGDNARKWHIGTRYCTVGSTPILMADWSHKPIADVRIGDEVIGWELRGGKRWLRKSKVVNRGVHFQQPVNRYFMENGRYVTCTADHKWWRGPQGSGPEYSPLVVPAKRQHGKKRIEVIGDPVERRTSKAGLTALRELLIPLTTDQSRDAGWLAGMFDGEGGMKINKNHPSGCVVITQTLHNPSVVEEIRACLTRLGFEWSEHWISAEGYDRMDHDRCQFIIKGGWRERYRFLTQIAPTRKEKLAASLFGQLQSEKRRLNMVAAAGKADVHWLETETGNYVANGFCSSNSFADPYQVIMERRAAEPRIYAATDNGRLDGKPVFISQKRWDEKKNIQRQTVSAQMLQNPIAGRENTFAPGWFRAAQLRPSILNVYIIVDPAGGRSKANDRTAMAVIGIDPAGNKYLLDGFRHRMPLSERWTRLRDLWKRWTAMPGVQLVKVGYERYGMQSDLEYIEEKMRLDGPVFSIQEVNWPNTGAHSKKARVGRLEPDFRMGRFWLPAVVWSNKASFGKNHPKAGQAYKGPCLWHVNEDKGLIEFEPMDQPTRQMQTATANGLGFRVSRPIFRQDEDKTPYDVTLALIEEMMTFPFAPKDDLVDAVSRIYDMEPLAPAYQDDSELRSYDFEDA